MKKSTIIGLVSGLSIGCVVGYSLSTLSVDSSVTFSTSTNTTKEENSEAAQKFSKTLKELESDIDLVEKQINPLLSEWNREYSAFKSSLASEDNVLIINDKLQEIGDKIEEKLGIIKDDRYMPITKLKIYPYYIHNHDWETLFIIYDKLKHTGFGYLNYYQDYSHILNDNEITEIKKAYDDYDINGYYGFAYQKAIDNQAKRLYRDDRMYQGFLVLKEGFITSMTNETASMIASYLQDLDCHEESFAVRRYGKTLPSHPYMIEHHNPFGGNEEEKSINYQKAREIKSSLEEGFFKFSDSCELSFYTKSEPFQTEKKSDY